MQIISILQLTLTSISFCIILLGIASGTIGAKYTVHVIFVDTPISLYIRTAWAQMSIS